MNERQDWSTFAKERQKPVRTGVIHLTLPTDWRQGQTMVNFIRWLEKNEKCPPYYLEDDKWVELYKKFTESYEVG